MAVGRTLRSASLSASGVTEGNFDSSAFSVEGALIYASAEPDLGTEAKM